MVSMENLRISVIKGYHRVIILWVSLIGSQSRGLSLNFLLLSFLAAFLPLL